jgi:hypothetical protein
VHPVGERVAKYNRILEIAAAAPNLPFGLPPTPHGSASLVPAATVTHLPWTSSWGPVRMRAEFCFQLGDPIVEKTGCCGDATCPLLRSHN